MSGRHPKQRSHRLTAMGTAIGDQTERGTVVDAGTLGHATPGGDGGGNKCLGKKMNWTGAYALLSFPYVIEEKTAFNDKKVGSDRRLRIGLDRVPGLNNEIIDFAERVANASERESIGVFPITDPHDAAKSTMILDLVLQLVIIQVAAKANVRENDDVRIVHAGPPDISASLREISLMPAAINVTA